MWDNTLYKQVEGLYKDKMGWDELLIRCFRMLSAFFSRPILSKSLCSCNKQLVNLKIYYTRKANENKSQNVRVLLEVDN